MRGDVHLSTSSTYARTIISLGILFLGVCSTEKGVLLQDVGGIAKEIEKSSGRYVPGGR